MLALVATLMSSMAGPRCAYGANLPQQLGLHTGEDVYHAACEGCHGHEGNGTPSVTAGFDRPESFPHFSKCDETQAEYTRDWKAVITAGGPARGFSQIMPSFAGVLTSGQIDALIAYLRSLCTDATWPSGELNVPRALLTEKAFPESETVLTSSINTTGPRGVSNELVYEKILGKGNQLEVAVPFGWSPQPAGGVTGGLGDIAAGIKHVLFAKFDPGNGAGYRTGTGSILSAQVELVAPTGNVSKGLGNGVTRLGIFAAYDRLYPQQAFLQLQAGLDLPLRTTYAPRATYLRSAFGKSFGVGGEFGRLWTPLLEVIANHELTAGATTDWDMVPEFQITLNRRQHIRAALGYRIPLNNCAGRPAQVALYVLWDWFDGGLLEGW